jgi:tRNA (cytidine/uridine-2'-O-)-methyltransferase
MNDKKLGRSAMDYAKSLKLKRHNCWRDFLDLYQGQQRLVLLTTKADNSYLDHNFRPDDILIAGRESAGVPDDVHHVCDERISIPMPGGGRSLNVVNALSMVAGEALRQTNLKG